MREKAIYMDADRRYKVKAAKYDERVLRMNPMLDKMLRDEALGEAIASAQTYEKAIYKLNMAKTTKPKNF